MKAIPARQFLKMLVLFSVLVSCSFEYERVLLTSEEKEKIPDTVLYNLYERVYEDGGKIIEFQSAVVRVFEARQIQEIEQLLFTQFDDDAEISIEGSAGFASRDMNNDDILLSEQVSIFIKKDSSRISGEKFLFSPEQDLIWAPDDVVVKFLRDDGTVLRGRGFIIDLLLQEIRFDKGASGVMMTEDKE